MNDKEPITSFERGILEAVAAGLAARGEAGRAFHLRAIARRDLASSDAKPAPQTDRAHKLVQRHANAARALEHMHTEKNVERLKAVGAELEAALAPSDAAGAPIWRPIETVPKDGTEVALLFASEVEILAQTCPRVRAASWRVDWTIPYRRDNPPTHWSPLPTAPNGAAPVAPSAPFDMLAHLTRQREFSERTFGPGARTKGVCDHIRKELDEIEGNPADLTEWIDVVILALDGAWRAGGSPQQIIDALVAKQTKNEGRTWPDWRTVDPNKAIEHDRSQDTVTPAAVAPTGEQLYTMVTSRFESGSLPWALVSESGKAACSNAAYSLLIAAPSPAVAADAAAPSDGPTREVIETLKEPVHIKKALLGGRNAHVVLSGGTGPDCAVFLVNIQLTSWSTEKEWANGYAKGFNQAAALMQEAVLTHAAQSLAGGPELEKKDRTIAFLRDQNKRIIETAEDLRKRNLERIAELERAAAPSALTDDQWINLAERHANRDWNSSEPDGFLNAVKSLCTDFAGIAARPTDDALWDQTLRERDRNCEWADLLANAIASHFEVDIGEHSNVNNPWREALDAIEIAAAAQPDERATFEALWHKARNAWLAASRHSTQEEADAAAIAVLALGASQGAKQ